MNDITVLEGIVIGSARGKRAAPLGLSYTRDLGESDLDLVLNPPERGTTTPALKSLRSVHHQLAKLLADGEKAVTVSAMTGYSQSRISILQQDPAFSELVAYYKQQKEALYLDVHQRLGSLGLTVVEELAERLEDEPEKFSVGQLLSVAEMALDRSTAPKKGAAGGSGNGPGNIQVNVNLVASPHADKTIPARIEATPSTIDIDLDDF